MKTQLSYLLLIAAVVASVLLAHPSAAPAQAPADDPALLAVIADVIAQQAAMQENQNNIDIKLAAVAEDVRQSRLFAARGGKGR